jgi:hypothetical protein
MKKFNLRLFVSAIAAVIGIGLISGCSDNTTPVVDNVDFSVTSSNGTADNVLIIDTAKVLIKDIKLNVASTNEDSVNFKVGPYVLYLNLNSEVNIISTAYIPPGTYDKVRFQIHKLGDTEPVPDPDFADSAGRYSVVVKGTFNAIPFIYKSTKSAHQKLTFPGSLVVTVNGISNITLKVMPNLWFIKDGLILDPMNESNRNDIDNNIKENINNNFKIFVDNDHNGIPD